MKLRNFPQTYEFEADLTLIKTISVKNKISFKTGLPLTPNSVIVYGRLEYLRSIQRIHKNLSQILSIKRIEENKVCIASRSQENSKLFEVIKVLHANDLALCSDSTDKWFLNYARKYGLLTHGHLDISGPAPEILFYNTLTSLPPIEALKAVDIYHLGSVYKNLPEACTNSDPTKRPSIEELSLGDKLETTKFFDLPKFTKPIESIEKGKLFDVWVSKEGGLWSLLLKLGLVQNIPGIMSISEKPSSAGCMLIKHAKITCEFAEEQLDSEFPLIMDWDLPQKKSSPEKKLQFHRRQDYTHKFKELMLFSHICAAYPITKGKLLNELRETFAPASLRPEIWACLLGVFDLKTSNHTGIFDVSKLSEELDRQLNVDIPRCHQYNNTLASPNGQLLLKNILSRWIIENTGKLTYWQGQDSLCAPFVVLFIDNPELAYKGFSKFIERLLPDMFQASNKNVIDRYLNLLQQLLNFFDPKLGAHLDEIGFDPKLYAIPWFLTMFSHVFSLDKIFILWDRLLLKTTNDVPEVARIFPVYIAVAMLSFVSQELLNFDFNQCLLWSSDTPDFDVYQIMLKSEKMFEEAPLSVGHWEEFTLSQNQIVPYITFNRLQVEISTSNCCIFDTRETVRYNAISLRKSHRLPYDDEVDFSASIFPHVGKLIVLVGDHLVCGKLAKQLISIAIPRVCILYEDIETSRNLQEQFRSMFSFQ